MDLPHSAALAWWLTAWLRGHEVTDHALDALAEDGVAHVVEGLDSCGTGLLDLFGQARRLGARGAGLALPVEGDPLGLGGPRTLNDLALESGEAVVLRGLAVVPHVGVEVVHWQVCEAAPRQVPDVGEADRGLRSALTRTATALVELDVARWQPELADALMNLRHRPVIEPPAGTPARCAELAARGLQARAIADLAMPGDGGAVTAQESRARQEALRPLERAARRAVVAACSPEVWPDRD